MSHAMHRLSQYTTRFNLKGRSLLWMSRRGHCPIPVSIWGALNQAEEFHTKILDTYYHPNSYAFYGNDFNQRSFGQCRWLSEPHHVGLSSSEVQKGTPVASTTFAGGRNVSFREKGIAYFRHTEQDTSGDGTVPSQSGAGPLGKVRQLFATRGYDHQGSYSNGAMLALTQHLIAKIVQGVL